MNLKPCPFCGGTNIDCSEAGLKTDVWFIQCFDCYATFPHFDSKEEATEAWNRRTAVDAVEVLHARWKTNWCDNNLIGHEYEECSNCGCSMVDTNQFWNSNYCPNCGADMRGESNE